jgi:hypothetical protein
MKLRRTPARRPHSHQKVRRNRLATDDSEALPSAMNCSENGGVLAAIERHVARP